MTVAISYARVFRIKNNVINILERNDSVNDINAKIEKYLKDIHYIYAAHDGVNNDCSNKLLASNLKDSSIVNGNINGVCVVALGQKTNDRSYYYYHYRVSAYIVIDFPLFKLGWVIPITGESKVKIKQT